MNRNSEFDFDPDLDSPLEALRRLRADARDAVVAVGSRTEAQGVAYITSALDTAITQLASADPPPHAIFVTGSAGGGKSGAAEYQRLANPTLFSDIVEDATHSDAPGRDQATTLAARLKLLADQSPHRPVRPILVAANIGMILQLARAWSALKLDYDAVVARLFANLGLPGGPTEPDGILPLDVRVLNLDDRPTSGPGALLEGMLTMLRPSTEGTLFDSTRCESCRAIAYCPARANAVLLSTVAAPALGRLAERAAVDRGRQDSPRALWDYLARAALPASHYDDVGDPCLASQQAHRDKNAWWVVTGLLPISMFGVDTDLGVRIAGLNPARAPRRVAYEAFANAGLRPQDDADPVRGLSDHARERGYDEPTLGTAITALEAGVPADVGELGWRDTTARTSLGISVLVGQILPQEIEEDAPFLEALDVYRRWQENQAQGSELTPDLLDEVDDRLDSVIAILTGGLARMFGQNADDRTFLPVQNYDPRQASRAFVEFDRDTLSPQLVPDRSMAANPAGSMLIGYRPLAVSLALTGGVRVEIDLPSYRLLAATHAGIGGDAERTFALRRTAEAIARAAAESTSVAMLVTDPTSRRRYQVTTQTGIGGRLNLRARAVNE